jgi:replicative DNA helicase
MPETLTLEQIRASIAERQQAETVEQTSRLHYVKPLSVAAEALIDVFQNPEGRFMFGIRPLDVMLRGVGKGELCLIVGRAHSGKSALALQAVVNNPNAKVLWFQWDESALLLLAKLCSVVTGTNGEKIEQAVRSGDAATIESIRRIATQTFRNLVVIDEPLGLEDMGIALCEAEQWWSKHNDDAVVDAVILDFLELLPGDQDATGVDAKVKGLKRWGKVHNVPLLCIHQANRSAGHRGKTIGMDSAKFGGDAEATMVLGVSRRRDDPELDPADFERVKDQITINVDKNKRPGGKRGAVDFYLDPDTGGIFPLDDLHPEPTAAERAWNTALTL